jgi:phosphoribosylformylglycinamidine synthase
MRARILVRPKAGILDPQGQAVERALPALGFAGVSNVHIGRLIELDVEDPSQLSEMCERLLANPLIESYEIADSASAALIGESAGAEPPGPVAPVLEGAPSSGSAGQARNGPGTPA